MKKPCPSCGSDANGISPLKNPDPRSVIYVCSNKKCKLVTKADGGLFVQNNEQLRDIFRGVTLGNVTLKQVLFGEKLNKETQAALMAMIVEYGLQMWTDGFKNGLLVASEKE